MRAMNIRVFTGSGGITQLKASFKKNWKHYLREALGLAIFMISACFFSGMLEAKTSSWHLAITNDFTRLLMMGVLMGSTAILIFYLPLTAPSGTHINPAVTIAFLRVGKMCKWDALFYVVFQFIGGIVAVYGMSLLMDKTLTAAPVFCAITRPGRFGIPSAAITEFIIAFVMMAMVMFTAFDKWWEKYTRIISGCLVCLFVIVAGPVSGFGMNPARSLASALPAHMYPAFWIYLIMPIAGMLAGTEFFLLVHRKTGKPGNNLV